MKKLLLNLFLCIVFSQDINAQVTGSLFACPAYLYDYSATVSGAASYNWTVPSGWIILSGQGTSQIHILCNANVGQVCADAFDINNIFLSQVCMTVAWGGGGVGWDAGTISTGPCLCDPVAVIVVPNSTSCSGGCGSGVASPYTLFGVYDNPWPAGNFIGVADGSGSFPLSSLGNAQTFYVYQIDTTLGSNNPILITGGGCPVSVNNSVTVWGCSTLVLGGNVTPDTVCVGDTFVASDANPFGAAYNWYSFDTSITLGASNTYTVQGVVNYYSPLPVQITLTTTDNNGCMLFGHAYVITSYCSATPQVAFTTNEATSFCPSTCIDFINQSVAATSYEWLFPGGMPSTSTDVNPTNICYSSSGSYDVTLIGTGSGGVDTMTMTNYMNVYSVNTPVITFSNDTLFTDQSYSSYQWYYNNNPVTGANSYFYAAVLDGDYGIVCSDTNGCSSGAQLVGVILSVENKIAGNGIVLFPNPASDELSIIARDGNEKILAIDLYNSTGKNVASSESHNSGKIIFPVKNIPDGIYFLKIFLSDGMMVKKVVIRHDE